MTISSTKALTRYVHHFLRGSSLTLQLHERRARFHAHSLRTSVRFVGLRICVCARVLQLEAGHKTSPLSVHYLTSSGRVSATAVIPSTNSQMSVKPASASSA